MRMSKPLWTRRSAMGGGCGAVVKKGAPVLEGEVGGDDGCGALIAAVEDLVEEVGAASVEVQVAQLVDQQEGGSGPGGETTVEGVASGAGDEVVDEICGGGESDTVAAEAGELADGVGEVGLADAGGPDEDAVGLVAEEVERGGAQDQLAVDARQRPRSRSPLPGPARAARPTSALLV